MEASRNSDDPGRALVTGASSGIGAAFAEGLARRGHDLVLVARRRDRLDRIAQQLSEAHGTKAEIIVADLTQSGDLQTVEARLERGDIDMLVNNAGIGPIAPFAEQARDVQARMIAINVLALTRLAHAAVAGMLPGKRGTIINLASGFAFDYMPGAAVYAATKSYVVQLTKVLHEELSGQGLRFQALVPGLTRTELGGAGDTSFFDQFPQEIVMEPEALVDASLAGLTLGEVVCLPRTEDYSTYERMHEMVRSVGTTPPHNRLATRYQAIIDRNGAEGR